MRAPVHRKAIVAIGLVAVLIAGCMQADDRSTTLPHSAEWGAGISAEVRCEAATTPMFMLEAHGDHGFGRTHIVVVHANGRLLVQEGFAGFERGKGGYRAFDDAHVEGATLVEACALAHLAPDIGGPDGMNGSYFEAYWIKGGKANASALQGFVAELREGFFAMPVDGSAHCDSGGDAWMQANLEGNVHAVDARCAGNPEFTRFRVLAESLASPLGSGLLH